MFSVILASHGELAKGMWMSCEMIIGHQEQIGICSLMPKDSPQDFKAQVETTLNLLHQPEEVLFLVDLWGGTPFNQIQTLFQDHKNYHLITGMNLALVIEVCMLRQSDTPLQEVVKQVLTTSKDALKALPQVSNVTEKKEVNIAIPPHKASGIGMDYVLARIDSRLLHGQVATGWTKSCQPDRIFVVSDQVAHDELRKKMIKQAAPVGVKAHVIPLAKLVALQQDARFAGMKVLLLFETVQDALAAIEAGIPLPTINLGSLAHREGKVAVSTTVSMDEDDVRAFQKLLEHNIQIDVRKVPADPCEDFMAMLHKASARLKGVA